MFLGRLSNLIFFSSSCSNRAPNYLNQDGGPRPHIKKSLLGLSRLRGRIRHLPSQPDESFPAAAVRQPFPPLYLYANVNAMHSALYAHKFHTSFWHDVDNPESFGFASMKPAPELFE